MSVPDNQLRSYTLPAPKLDSRDQTSEPGLEPPSCPFLLCEVGTVVSTLQPYWERSMRSSRLSPQPRAWPTPKTIAVIIIVIEAVVAVSLQVFGRVVTILSGISMTKEKTLPCAWQGLPVEIHSESSNSNTALGLSQDT